MANIKIQLLEGLGKAKATQDDVFDQHAANLNKQSKAIERLNRDMKGYATALKAYVQAQKILRETIRELYEPTWPDREHVFAITQVNSFILLNNLQRQIAFFWHFLKLILIN